MFDRTRWAYLARCASAYLAGSRRNCPNCHSRFDERVGRKLVITELVRCRECKLLYRIPTDPPAFGEDFYQDHYSQGFTTDCPSPTALRDMLASSFKQTPKDFTDKLALLNALNVAPGARILDYGASWGYGTWQFQQAGYSVLGFELGRTRARYAREQLSVNVVDCEDQIEGPFDAVFSSHVLEHIPQPARVIRAAEKWLRPSGLFVAYTPNGSTVYRAIDPGGYHRHWGMVHPNYLDEQFYITAMPTWRLFLSGTPVDLEEVRKWDRKTTKSCRLDSWELLVIGERYEEKVMPITHR